MSYTINLTNSQSGEIISKYHEFSVPHTNNYTLFRAKYKAATLTIFKTLTLMIQGSNAIELYKEVCQLLNIDDTGVNEDSPADHQALDINLSIIGTDEVGTGDFFGPVVVAGAFVPKTQISSLMRLGVKDSKNLSDEKIKNLAPILMKDLKYSALVLDNKKYNYLTRMLNYNMNKIKALLHNNVIYNLLQKVEDYDTIIVDGFTTKDKYLDYLKTEKVIITDVELLEKGESKHISIAAASIIARYLFLNEMDKLSTEIGFDLPKGAGNKVDLAISKILKEQRERYFDICAKTNFRNIDKVKKKESR